jgi:hypothetical protein
MTEESVDISITIKVEKVEYEIHGKIEPGELEEKVQAITQELGQQVIKGVVDVMDTRLAARIPAGWRNVGTEERWLTTSLGTIRYRRRVYIDEEKRRRKLVDEMLGLERYGRISRRVQEMGTSLASMGTYRLAARQLSWLIKSPVSHSSLQRMSWAIGNRIADGEEAERRRIFDGGEQLEGGKVPAEVLYGESDGVWVHLQREEQRSTEVRVAILSTGKKPIGSDRYRLENKHWVTAVGINSEMWQEQIVREAHLKYDLAQIRILISGGDGNQWVRHSFDRMDVPQEFVLDRFHLARAASRAYKDRVKARRMVTRLRMEKFEVVSPELLQHIQLAEGKAKKLLEEFYLYVHNNRDGLLDLEHRSCSIPAHLGAIEGNVDKLVVHRMKGRGRSWRLRGLRAMLALCRHSELLRSHAYKYYPIHSPSIISHRSSNLEVEYSEVMQAHMPIFFGPDQSKPWVRSLHYLIHGS